LPRRRGRPSKQGKSLNELAGVSGEFTVKDIVEKNDIKEYEAHNLVRSAVKSGKLQVVKEISGGRGKPKKVYRLA
jgi:predicted ArsR family transcriptional regulator